MKQDELTKDTKAQIAPDGKRVSDREELYDSVCECDS